MQFRDSEPLCSGQQLCSGEQLCSGQPIHSGRLLLVQTGDEAVAAARIAPGSGAVSAADPSLHPSDPATEAQRSTLPSGAAPAQVVQVPLQRVRFLQAMAEYGSGARPCRIPGPPAQSREYLTTS